MAESKVLEFPRSRVIRIICFDHIKVVSRHDLVAEIDGMRSMLGLMWDADVLPSIDRIFCNSKASPAFDVRMCPAAAGDIRPQGFWRTQRHRSRGAGGPFSFYRTGMAAARRLGGRAMTNRAWPDARSTERAEPRHG